jgi:hypothetical protein
MAMEVEEARWTYAQLRQQTPSGDYIKVKLPLFMHTPLHDLESLLWIIVSTLDSRYFHPHHLFPWQTTHFWTIFASSSSKKAFMDQVNVDSWLEPAAKSISVLQDLATPMYTLVESVHQSHVAYQSDPHKFVRRAYADHMAPRDILVRIAKLDQALTKTVPLFRAASDQAQPSISPTEPLLHGLEDGETFALHESAQVSNPQYPVTPTVDRVPPPHEERPAKRRKY